jgi:hypothetical protein
VREGEKVSSLAPVIGSDDDETAAANGEETPVNEGEETPVNDGAE